MSRPQRRKLCSSKPLPPLCAFMRKDTFWANANVCERSSCRWYRLTEVLKQQEQPDISWCLIDNLTAFPWQGTTQTHLNTLLKLSCVSRWRFTADALTSREIYGNVRETDKHPNVSDYSIPLSSSCFHTNKEHEYRYIQYTEKHIFTQKLLKISIKHQNKHEIVELCRNTETVFSCKTLQWSVLYIY